MKVDPIPAGYHTITPYLVVKDSVAVLDFLKKAFDAAVLRSNMHENGTIANAEIKIGTSMVMLTEASEQFPALPTVLYLYVEDTDAVYKKAIAAGGVSIMEPMDMFYGDRNGGVKDSSGNQWWIATHIEDISDEEMKIRAENQPKRS